MVFLKGILDAIFDWSVERKMVLVLFVSIVIFPLIALIVLQSRGMSVATNFIVIGLTVSIVLLVPLAKWMSYFVATRNIKDMNKIVTLIKEGDYSQIGLPTTSEVDEPAFMILKRNIQWMGHAIATRAQRLQKAMSELAVAQHQIGESLNYASLIQKSFLPNRDDLYAYLPEHFLLWRQRDTVGGDAYWFKEWGNGFFVGVIDCTGHGVPGAFMTLIVHSLLEKVVVDCSDSPAEVLGKMNRSIKDALGQNQKGAMSDDGMDCVLCHVNPDTGRMVFAGANNPLYIIDEDGARFIKGDRCGLGYVRSPRDFVFTDVEIELRKGRRIYMTTDGLVDQVGDTQRFPFGKGRFMRFMEESYNTPLGQQGSELERRLKSYQGEETRRDDVTVLGFELSKEK